MSSSNNSPATATATAQASPIDNPYTLFGDFDPEEKLSLTPGDVYRSQRQRAYFRVIESDTLDLQREWLSTPVWCGSHDEVEPLPETIRSWYAKHDPLDLIAVDVPSRQSVWFLTEAMGPRVTADDAPDTTNALTCNRIRSRIKANHFLNHPLVGHQRGGVAGWKACFGAQYHGELVAIAVLSRPSARHSDDGTKIELSRFGSHPLRPPNTGSWLLAQAREWARLEGYDKLISFSGVAGNDGTLYQALGLDQESSTTTADGQGWGNRGGRDSWDDYERHKFTDRLGNDTTTTQRTTPADTEHQQQNFNDIIQNQDNGPYTLKQINLARYDTHSRVDSFINTHCSAEHDITFSDRQTAVFTAEHQTQPLAMCIVAPPSAPLHPLSSSDSAVTIAYAHDKKALTAPVNTGAWLFARIRHWAQLQGYEQLRSCPLSSAHHAVSKRADVPQIGVEISI